MGLVGNPESSFGHYTYSLDNDSFIFPLLYVDDMLIAALHDINKLKNYIGKVV